MLVPKFISCPVLVRAEATIMAVYSSADWLLTVYGSRRLCRLYSVVIKIDVLGGAQGRLLAVKKSYAQDDAGE